MVKLLYNFVLEFSSSKSFASMPCWVVMKYIRHLKIWQSKENQKRWAYNQRVVEVEHGSLIPLVLSATGGMGTAASICYKQIAVKLSVKSNTPYKMTMAWLRTNISFSLLCLAIQYIRSSCSRNGRPQTETSSRCSSNAELVTVEAGLRIHYSCFVLLYILN